MLKQSSWQRNDERNTFTIADGIVSSMTYMRGNYNTLAIKIINTHNYLFSNSNLKNQFMSAFLCVKIDMCIQDY